MHAIREIWIRYPVAPGVELHINRDLDEQERKRIQEVVRIARSVMKGGDENE